MVASNLATRQHEASALDATVLDELASMFAIGKVTSCEFLPAGLMNRNWRLHTDTGAFALKECRDSSRGDMHRNLAAAAELRQAGLPVPAPQPTRRGALAAEAAGSQWCLLPWTPGEHRPGPELTAGEAQELGSILGLIHHSLRDCAVLPAPGPPKWTPASDAEAAVALRRFAALIAARPAPDTFDKAAAALLDQRMRLLSRFADGAPPLPRTTEPFGWTHGDFQHLNVLWEADEIVAVLDWDRIKPQFLADEVARAAVIQCEDGVGGLDLANITAFAGGYRAVTGTAGSALAAAADRLWWKRLTGSWQLIFHYDRGDNSCDHLFTAGEAVLAWWCEHRAEVTAAFTCGE